MNRDDDVRTIRDALLAISPGHLPGIAALDRLAARLADGEEAAIGYQRQSSEQADEAAKWRERAQRAERERDEALNTLADTAVEIEIVRDRDDAIERAERAELRLLAEGLNVQEMKIRAESLAEALERAEQRTHQCVFPTCVDGDRPEWCGHCGDAERADSAEARNRELTEALLDAAVVVERMANGASRKECSPEFERFHTAVLAADPETRPA